MNKLDNDTQPILKVRNLRTEFEVPDGVVNAVDDVSFSVERGKTLCIVGESGSGKSVTVRSLLRLISAPGRIVSGEALFQGEDLLQMSNRRINELRGDRISMIFQNPLTSLNPAMSVGMQVSEGLLLHRDMGKSEAWQEAVRLLKDVGIPSPEQRASDYPAQFSGGMRQRIMIAAALSCKPDVLIADEPTTALDVSMQAQILRLLRDLQGEINNALIMITHDLGVVAEIADDVIVMYSGRVVEQAPVEELFARPRHPYTLGLIDTVVALDSADRPLKPIPGTPAVPKGERHGCDFAPRCPFSREICNHTTPEMKSYGTGHLAACHMADEMERSDD